MEVKDLDVLRPESKIIRIGGKDIDVSFVPCGITFEVDDIIQELGKMDQTKIMTDPIEMKKAFNLSIDLCVVFCSHKYPELNADWFKENTDANQINAFSESIKEALARAYKGIENTGKNLKAAKAKKK